MVKFEILKILKKHEQPEKNRRERRCVGLGSLSKKFTLLSKKYLKENPLVRLRQRGRPRTYDNTLILTLWLYQTLWRASYREVLEIAQQAGFSTPALSTYHYRVSQLPLKLFQYLIIQIGKNLTSQNSTPWRLYWLMTLGLVFQDRYALSLCRGETLRQVRAHMRLVILAMVDVKGRTRSFTEDFGRPTICFRNSLVARYSGRYGFSFAPSSSGSSGF